MDAEHGAPEQTRHSVAQNIIHVRPLGVGIVHTAHHGSATTADTPDVHRDPSALADLVVHHSVTVLPEMAGELYIAEAGLA